MPWKAIGLGWLLGFVFAGFLVTSPNLSASLEFFNMLLGLPIITVWAAPVFLLAAWWLRRRRAERASRTFGVLGGFWIGHVVGWMGVGIATCAFCLE